MSKLEELFNEAIFLFGDASLITASVQNPGCLQSQQDVDDVFTEIHRFSRKADFDFVQRKRKIHEWSLKLQNAYLDGELN